MSQPNLCNNADWLSGFSAFWFFGLALCCCDFIMRAFFGGSRASTSPSNAASEAGPEQGEMVVAGTPVTFHPPHPVEVVLAHEVGHADNLSEPASRDAARAAETMVVHTNAQRLQIAESLRTHLKEFQPNICMLNQDQLLRHACDLATAPDWMKQVYNTEQNFTWALAGFNVLLSSFYSSGTKTPASVKEVTGCVWAWEEKRSLPF